MVEPIPGGGAGVYYAGVRCVHCHGAAWHVGAVTASCAGCGHVLVVIGGQHPATIMARPRGGSWRPGRYELADTRVPTPASAVIMARKGRGEWSRAL